VLIDADRRFDCERRSSGTNSDGAFTMRSPCHQQRRPKHLLEKKTRRRRLGSCRSFNFVLASEQLITDMRAAVRSAPMSEALSLNAYPGIKAKSKTRKTYCLNLLKKMKARKTKRNQEKTIS
jgi:hypothetical protein